MRQVISTRPPCQPGRFHFRHFFFGLAILLAAGLLFAATAVADTETTPAPPFTLKSLDGGKRSLQDYRGRYLLLNFWATWCGPCKIEMPSLEALHRRFEAANLTVLGVSNDPFGERVVEPFMKAYDLTFPVLLDPNQEISKRYGVHSLPTTFLIDPEGRILGVLAGAEDWSKPETIAYFMDLLNVQRGTPRKSSASVP
ncbi:peroxiredoxin family protein [Nitrospina gracilis]|uniref:peroxiredoxin family protein n=1 Tax=Nitrospina gracilis TaxID=35801 RepID=UPI001F24190C|nr:TlpA disulfide reductase family protein [Nitrospina gracilis]MCF8721575.1 peroxiredoxin [Nitrospina gracilis Nb-211]